MPLETILPSAPASTLATPEDAPEATPDAKELRRTFLANMATLAKVRADCVTAINGLRQARLNGLFSASDNFIPLTADVETALPNDIGALLSELDANPPADVPDFTEEDIPLGKPRRSNWKPIY